MPDESLARDAYVGIDVELPTGKMIRLRPLTLSQSIEFLELLEHVAAGDLSSMRRILTEFPKAVDAGKAFEALTPGEVFDVLRRFFAARRTVTASLPPLIAAEPTQSMNPDSPSTP